VDRRLIVHLALLVPLVGLGACSSTSFSSFSFSKKGDSGLSNVDELLTRIEKVQVEALVAKERAHGAYGLLQQTVAPNFRGNAVEQFKSLTESIKASEKQSKTLADTVPALKSAANVVFERWTKDLENFGNTRMRQRSQERMEATREQYETIVRQTVAAQLSLEALNADLNDHALFLGHDFNSESAMVIHDDVAALQPRVAELDGRLDAAIQSAKQYIASRALRGEVEAADEVEGDASKTAAKGQRRKARQQQQAEGAAASSSSSAAAADGGTR
jgi:hypothetical protein